MAEEQTNGIRTKFGEVTGIPAYQVRGPGSHIWYSTPQQALTQYNKLVKFANDGGFTTRDNKGKR
jgi:hypothetical protein